MARVVVNHSTFGKPTAHPSETERTPLAPGKSTSVTDGPNKVKGGTKVVNGRKMSAARKRWLDKGKNKATLQATDEMLSSSVSVSKNVRNTYTGGTRYSAGKFPVSTRSIVAE